MGSTYAAYHNLSAMPQNYGRRTSSESESSVKPTVSKIDKIMKFLEPRIPLNPPLTPTGSPFRKAKKGNATTIAERRQSSSAHGKGSVSSSVDSAYDVHLPGGRYFGMDEK